jgi:hypothetical protein
LSWNDLRRPAAALVALGLLSGIAGTAVADTLVVRSAGPSARNFPPGKPIADSARIVLQANDQVVLLDGRGTRTLKGPGTFSPLAQSSSAADTRSTFAALVAQHSERRARIGAVRSMSAEPARSPNIWFVDLDRSSTVCVADPGAVTMWRAGTPKPAAVTITALPDPPAPHGRKSAVAAVGSSETTAWPREKPTMPWPATLPITTGARYRISFPGATQPTQVRFAVLPPGGQGLEDLASTLIRNGCTAQLDLLIDTVTIPQSAPSGG